MYSPDSTVLDLLSVWYVLFKVDQLLQNTDPGCLLTETLGKTRQAKTLGEPLLSKLC